MALGVFCGGEDRSKQTLRIHSVFFLINLKIGVCCHIEITCTEITSIERGRQGGKVQHLLNDHPRGSG